MRAVKMRSEFTMGQLLSVARAELPCESRWPSSPGDALLESRSQGRSVNHAVHPRAWMSTSAIHLSTLFSTRAQGLILMPQRNSALTRRLAPAGVPSDTI